jgi:hypothetical protein
MSQSTTNYNQLTFHESTHKSTHIYTCFTTKLTFFTHNSQHFTFNHQIFHNILHLNTLHFINQLTFTHIFTCFTNQLIFYTWSTNIKQQHITHKSTNSSFKFHIQLKNNSQTFTNSDVTRYIKFYTCSTTKLTFNQQIT